jgi:hypothetical protein
VGKPSDLAHTITALGEFRYIGPWEQGLSARRLPGGHRGGAKYSTGSAPWRISAARLTDTPTR